MAGSTPTVRSGAPFRSLQRAAPRDSWRPLGLVTSLRGAVSPPRLARVPREDLSLLIAGRPGGVTGNGLLGGRWGRLDGAPALLRTVYTGWRLNSLTISLEICYCSRLKGTDRRHFGCRVAPPPLGIAMKDSASSASCTRVLPVQVGRGDSHHPPRFSFVACPRPLIG